MPCSSTTGFLIFLATLLVSLITTNSNNLSTDRSSLTALKSYVTSDPTNILKNRWSDSTFVCNWTGVTCGTDPLRVVGLNLSYAGLVGSVPPHLGNLSSLVELRLQNNSFHGVLPNELSRLRQLKNLSFGYNDLSGEIPSWLGSLPKLRVLWLYGNRFSGPIPQFVFNMSSLKNLALAQNDLFGTLPDSLCQHLPNIERLYFHENNLSGRIPSRLSECKQLGVLSLSSNNFQGDIPKSVANLSRATEIHLHENKLSGTIPDEIGSLHYLETFQVFNNVLKGPIPQFVFNMSSLKKLTLSQNDFFGTLPDNLCQHLPNIEELYFVENNLSGRIPSRLSECKQLRVLSLGSNNFQGDIPKSVANLSRATEIYLDENKLSGTIPQDIGNLDNLERLNLRSNNIIGTIPPTLFNITTIKSIELSMNHLCGGLPPNCGLWLPNLEELYLHTNNLSGSLPESISNASKLTILSIGSNHFSGLIPNTLSALNKLEFLNLFSNNLTLSESSDNILYALPSLSHLRLLSLSANPLSSRLPLSIGSNVSNSLQTLVLYNCNLRGHIPASLVNFSALIVLSLWGNQFSGFIPPSIGMLQKLQGLYLHDNILEGPIPLELCKIQSLYGLYLHNNTLSGSIPWCLGHIASLRELSLATNNFNSTIPSTIWEITDILKVDLSSNSLTGSLSTDIGNLKVLTYFNVSNNQLSGNISSSMGYLQSLQALDLAKNNIQGSIPDSMGNLLSLEYLDLSNNRLSGVIPKLFEKLSYLKFLNLSFNKLYGEIPSGGPFSKFNAQSFIKNDNLCGALRLQVPLCKSLPRKSHKHLTVKWIIPSVTVVAIAIIVSLLTITFRRKKTRNPNLEGPLVALRRVSPFELSTATDGFKEENLLGVGGFGSVYKGTLSDGLVVAIKVFNLQLEEAFETFSSECQVLCTVRHRNLVKIITCCSSPDFKALVLQYMPHGSLDKWLYADGFILNLLQRLNIMIDIASALEYLHYGYSTPIVHCDLKPNNVLLDENMVAHVADFGIAKLLCGDYSMTQTMTLATIGYMAPEYGVGGVVSRRGDVYSFGIMLMEVFTKKKPIDDMFSEEMNLKQWVQNSIPDAITEVIDVDLLRPEDTQYLINKDCIASVLELALTCSASSPEQRISMKVVVDTLEKIKRLKLS